MPQVSRSNPVYCFSFFTELLVLSFYSQFLGFLHQFHCYGVTYSKYGLGVVVKLFMLILRFGLGLVLGLSVGLAVLIDLHSYG